MYVRKFERRIELLYTNQPFILNCIYVAVYNRRSYTKPSYRTHNVNYEQNHSTIEIRRRERMFGQRLSISMDKSLTVV